MELLGKKIAAVAARGGEIITYIGDLVLIFLRTFISEVSFKVDIPCCEPMHPLTGR
jgi:hypothetical protein